MDPSQNLHQIQLSPSLDEILRVGVVFLNSLVVRENSPQVRKPIEAFAEELRRTIGDRAPSELETVARSRRLYKSIGLDPTKDRPSSEKLLRRVLQGRPLPVVNDFVDSMNLISLRFQFPLGFYDWDRIAPPVLIRMGRPDESYRGIGGEMVSLQGKLVLVDGEGPFGNPTRDSERTCILPRTVRALVVAFAPRDTARAAFDEAIHEIVVAAEHHCGARASAAGLVPI